MQDTVASGGHFEDEEQELIEVNQIISIQVQQLEGQLDNLRVTGVLEKQTSTTTKRGRVNFETGQLFPTSPNL